MVCITAYLVCRYDPPGNDPPGVPYGGAAQPSQAVGEPKVASGSPLQEGVGDGGAEDTSGDGGGGDTSGEGGGGDTSGDLRDTRRRRWRKRKLKKDKESPLFYFSSI